MDDEGIEDAFIPPPTQNYMGLVLPLEASTNAIANNSSVTLARVAADATEAEANPGGLDWHHGERRLMAGHSEMDGVKASAAQNEEPVDTSCPLREETSTVPKDQDLASVGHSLTETCSVVSEGHHPDDITLGEESDQRPGTVFVLSGGQEKWRETKAESDNYPQQVPSSFEENSGNETLSGEEEDNPKLEDICSLAETDLTPPTDEGNNDDDDTETNAPALSGFIANDDHLESQGPQELCQCPSDKMEDAVHRSQGPESPRSLPDDDKKHVDTGPLNNTVTNADLARRNSETRILQSPISEGSDGTLSVEEQGDGGRQIATDIQQGEQLLQRLQLLQQRQDLETPPGPDTCQVDHPEMIGERNRVVAKEEYLTGVECKSKESMCYAVEATEGEQVHLVEMEESESVDVAARPRMALPAMPEKPDIWVPEDSPRIDPHETSSTPISCASTPYGSSATRTSIERHGHEAAEREEVHAKEKECHEGDNVDAKPQTSLPKLPGESDSWVPEDLSQSNTHETPSATIPFASNHHRFSAAETNIERQIQEAAQAKQHLQRAGGVFNLAENPDVLEIPLKTNIVLEQLANDAGADQHSGRQFSEQKMQREISQEIQRELVLVNQGKIPGGYSKGEVRQLKETKQLFEAFQHDNTDGPTRRRKPPADLAKGHVYPSVLERTCSLEMFSLKRGQSVSRAHSLKQHSSATPKTNKSPEDLRSRSPTGGSREKTFSYKNMRLYKSMDSISSDVTVSTSYAESKTRQGNSTEETSILKQNPFFKLRPALALQPEVEKDIREAREREVELQRQRCALYGDNRPNSADGENPQLTSTLTPDVKRQSRGKLERVWPPPSKKDLMKSEQTQPEAKVPRAGGQKASLWQRWEAGLINRKSSHNND